MIRVLALLVPLLLPAAASAQTNFAQLDGPGGCLITPEAFEPIGGCVEATALNDARQVAITPDGAQVVTVSGDEYEGGNGIAVLKRDPQSGGVSFASCTSDDAGTGLQGTEGTCADGDALAGATAIAFSPDGRFAYVAAAYTSAVTWLARDAATGALTQAGCIKQTIRAGERCTQGAGLDGADAIAISPDGSHVYVAGARSSTVTVFKRDAGGALTPQSCVSQSGSDGACARVPGLTTPRELALTGANLYVIGDNALTTLAVAPTGDLTGKGCLLSFASAGGPCTAVPVLARPLDAVLPADGRGLIVLTDDENLLSFTRDPATGALSLQQCFRQFDDDPLDPDDPAGACTMARWDEANAIAVSPDGRAAFVAGSEQITAYRRDPATGRLGELGCVSGAGSGCGPLRGATFPIAMAASADARNLYVANRDGGLIAFQLTVAITSATARGSAVRVALACPAARREGCAGRLTGARAARFRLASGKSRAITVRLTARQRTRLHRRRRVAIALRAQMRGVAATTRRVTLRATPSAHAAKRARP
jgi:sugar lactone lactonase YvrE